MQGNRKFKLGIGDKKVMNIKEEVMFLLILNGFFFNRDNTIFNINLYDDKKKK